MCGIFGLITKSKDFFDSIDFELVKKLLYHRGPDDSNMALFKSKDWYIKFIHTRLSIIDLSEKGKQPLSNEDKSIHIIFNGEIYNYKDLKDYLVKKGHIFFSNTDSEVILHLYEELGEKLFDKIKGIFAFAIFDTKNNILLLGRDHFGVKPLYYTILKNSEGIAFTSEIRVFLGLKIVQKKISLQGLNDYITFGSICEPNTILDDVLTLPPSHYLIFKDGEYQIKNFWKLEDISQNNTLKRKEIYEKVEELLLNSLTLNIIADVPWGVFLSGGVDSSVITIFLREKLKQEIHTLSLILKEENLSERKWAEFIAEKFNTKHKSFEIDGEYIRNCIFNAIDSLDQPSVDGINTYLVCKLARDLNLRVALSGLGSDEIFCGYPAFRDIKYVLNLRKYLRYFPIKYLEPLFLRENTKQFAKKVFVALSRINSIVDYYILRRSIFLEFERKIILKPDLFRPIYFYIPESVKKWDLINQWSYLEITHYLRNTLLRDTDCMSMSNSLEVRVPYLDHDLVSFVLSIPGSKKIEGNYKKSILLELVKPYINLNFFRRKKQFFTLPFQTWFKIDLKKIILDIIYSSSEIDRILNRDFIDRLIYNFYNTQGIVPWPKIWLIVILKYWFMKYIE